MAENTIPPAKTLGYRAEIDGLRAIAVLAVVLFHARLGVPGGGYAGVDVFFVISGFLISRLIGEEYARSGRFSLAGFYERRIRRLFPALVAVVVATLAVGWWQLPPGELVALARSGFAALAFFSNLHFARQAGYFQAEAETQPLLHTWSLGVEEQFYILAPLVIVGLLKLSLRHRRLVLGALALVSLGFAVLVPQSQREAAFFWPYGRAYELLMGAALGLRLVPLPTGERARGGMAAAGLVMIALSLLLLREGGHFPGYLALFPCLGTALVIAATEGGAIPGVVGTLLSAAPMRFFGRISYSLYLWHWPVMVYAALAHEGPLPLAVRLGLVVISIGLAWVSYRFIETPARHGVARWRLLLVFAPALGVMGAGFVVSALVTKHQGYPARFGPAMTRLVAGMAEPQRTGPRCAGAHCLLGDGNAPVSFILLGDSHARVLAPEISHIAQERGLGGILLMRDGCPPLLDEQGQSIVPSRKCREVGWRLDTLLAAQPKPRIIIAARWALYAEASPFGAETGTEGRALVPGGLEANRRAFAEGLQRTLAVLQRAGADVRLMGPVPEQGRDIQALMARRVMRGQVGEVFVERARFDVRQASVMAALEAARGQGAKVLYPHTILCDAAQCRASEDGLPLYFDDDHLSLRGANRIRALLGQALE